MKTTVVFVVCSYLTALTQCQNITLTNDTISCLRCICHATSGCYSLQKCAEYGINEIYWRQAGRPTVSPEDAANETLAYRNCVVNDTCVLQTVYGYTYHLGDTDCNCDGTFNCDDRLAIHFNGCENLRAIHMFQRRQGMYEDCRKRPMRLGYDNCEHEDV